MNPSVGLDISATSRLLNSWDPSGCNSKLMTETRSPTGSRILKGILQKADVLNQNGRIYPRAVLEREVRNYQKFIRERRSLGELDHPDTSVVELKNTSHLVTKAWMEGNDVLGEVEILNTPSGLILQSLIDSKVTLGISSRGVGSTRKDGDRQIVQDDFQLICWDFVSEPSTPGAFMIPEGIEVSRKELDRLFTREDRIDRILNDIASWRV